MTEVISDLWSLKSSPLSVSFLLLPYRGRRNVETTPGSSPLHYFGLLVHFIHFICKSRRDDCEKSDGYIFGHWVDKFPGFIGAQIFGAVAALFCCECFFKLG